MKRTKKPKNYAGNEARDFAKVIDKAMSDSLAGLAAIHNKQVTCPHAEWKLGGHWHTFQNEPTWYESYKVCVKCDALFDSDKFGSLWYMTKKSKPKKTDIWPLEEARQTFNRLVESNKAMKKKSKTKPTTTTKGEK
jgi:hypothetical protein